ncbi:Serine/threonine-protein kinase pim-1 [Nibea albiflora]|uniref:Serine/threonine-protein kinase pim-1 n=1 Tax=Nibea albiflora TaxID=240163 RepID=A0ACB7F743_NIBAL|nr:Serine/threonine-protein kinase pim-1 [Nibea albiflora]
MLGKGSYGSVFAGERKRDNLPVAIKEISQQDVDRIPVLVDGDVTMVPLEVALLLTLEPAESESSAVVTLLDWFDLEDVLILVLERPDPCMGMYDYIYREEHRIKEDEAKIMTRQLVDALIEIHSKGVFHGDIKADNILIETGSDVPRVRVIDFGIGAFLSGDTLNAYAEREVFLCSPPEMWKDGTFQAESTTVWQLGLVVYEILHRRLPFQSGFGIKRRRTCVSPRLSVELIHLKPDSCSGSASDSASIFTGQWSKCSGLPAASNRRGDDGPDRALG